MTYDSVFDSAENQALLAVCAHKTIRTAAIAGIVWGAINLGIGYFAVQANPLNAGILVLGFLMLGAGVTAMRKPSLHSLLAEAFISLPLLFSLLPEARSLEGSNQRDGAALRGHWSLLLEIASRSSTAANAAK
jgi:hypothetical protein